MVLLSIILFVAAIIIVVYNLIPEKSKEVTLLKRIKKKIPKIVTTKKKKEPAKEYINKFIDFLERKSRKWNIKYLNEYKENLIVQIQKAGNLQGITPDRLFAMQLAASIGCIIFYGFILCWLLEALDFNVVFAIISLIVGFFYPTLIWLKGLIDKRTKTILKALPDVIDLLTLCVEAGLDFGAALRKIVDKGREGPLKEEFTKLEKEISMGASRIEALRNMSRRNDIDDLNSFLIAIIQAVKMGTSMGAILRTQAEQIRIKRSQRAEKIAAEAPIKMLAPLIICIFPTVFIILFVPIIMQVMGLK